MSSIVLMNFSNSLFTSSRVVSPDSANSISTSTSPLPNSKSFHNFISFSNNDIFFKWDDADILSFQKSGKEESFRSFSNLFCLREKSKIPP